MSDWTLSRTDAPEVSAVMTAFRLGSGIKARGSRLRERAVTLPRGTLDSWVA